MSNIANKVTDGRIGTNNTGRGRRYKLKDDEDDPNSEIELG